MVGLTSSGGPSSEVGGGLTIYQILLLVQISLNPDKSMGGPLLNIIQ